MVLFQVLVVLVSLKKHSLCSISVLIIQIFKLCIGDLCGSRCLLRLFFSTGQTSLGYSESSFVFCSFSEPLQFRYILKLFSHHFMTAV